MLAGQAEYLAVGQIPDPIKRVGGKGGTAPGPDETNDICWAVTYIRAVRDGRVQDPKPVAFVRDLYNLRNELTVRKWCRTYEPFPFLEALTEPSLRKLVASAACRYRHANTRTWAASGRKRRQKTKSK